MTVTITTNNVPRFTIDAYEIPRADRDEFDYLNWEAIDAGMDSATFFRYKGQLYDVGEFMTTRELHPGAGYHDLSGWDGYQSDTFFSGIVIRWVDNDFGSLIVGRYCT